MRVLNVRRRSPVLSSAVLIGVAICGCSSGSSTGTTSPAMSTPSSTSSAGAGTAARPSSTTASATSTTAAAPGETALEGMLLTQADLPPGWSPTPNTDSDDPTSGAAVDTCVGLKDTSADQVASAQSDDFDKGNATVSSDVKSFKSIESITQHRNAFDDTDKLGTCLETAMRKQLKDSAPAGASIEDISVTAEKGPADGQPSSVEGAVEASVKLTVKGQTVTLHLRTTYLSRGHVRARVTSEDIQTIVPTDLQNTLVSAVDKRLPQE